MDEQSETMEQSTDQVAAIGEGRSAPPFPMPRPSAAILPQMGNGSCGCGAATGNNGNGSGGMEAISYVYAIGHVEARFPNLSAEKEFAQATGRADTAGKTDQQAFHEVLSQRQNRYLVQIG